VIKDIEIKKVEDMIVAIVPRLPDEEGYEDFWDSYFINLKDEAIRSVLVNSTGYGEVDGVKRRTAVFRHFWEEVGPLQLEKIEPIHVSLFNLAHEFWISFTSDNYLYDKRYVFVPGSLEEDNFTEIPFLGRQGVMIR